MRDQVRILEVKKTILEDNDADAAVLKEHLKEEGTFYINVMSSPGAGKTSTLLKVTGILQEDLKVGVMEADIDSDVDAVTMEEHGIPSVQLHTCGMCHLDADMSRQGLRLIGSQNFDVIFLENVGNLVCPAEFDTGAHMNLVILSVPEGDDKPLKYPLMFEKADAVVINKIDAAPAFDFSLDRVQKHIHARHAGIPIFPVSARTGEGIEALAEFIFREYISYEGGCGK
ncbi:MAG: hydrogenase nickel incorporation protein HypB [Lachnospiraceae bacterium]|nr:hydrogenase nickel incorporation protein HypB [Lachnospiraceae bacterium]